MPPPESTSPVLAFARAASLLTTFQLSGVPGAGARKTQSISVTRRRGTRAAGRIFSNFRDLWRSAKAQAFRKCAILRHYLELADDGTARAPSRRRNRRWQAAHAQ